MALELGVPLSPDVIVLLACSGLLVLLAVLGLLRRAWGGLRPRPVSRGDEHPESAREIVSEGPAIGEAVANLDVASAPVSVEPETIIPAYAPELAEVTADAAPPFVAPPAPRVRPRPKPAALDTSIPPETLLERASALLAAGHREEAATQLRLCLRLAAVAKQPALEARARLELGDIAFSNNDLTTACEHWQLARALYGQLQNKKQVKSVEWRMEHNHCPTDWVLTQF